MMLQKIGIAQLNVFCTALCLTISALPDRQTDPHHSRSESSKNQLGTAQPQLVFSNLYGQMITVKITRKAKVWSWADRPMTKSLAGLTYK